jgi:hypothetical protein
MNAVEIDGWQMESIEQFLVVATAILPVLLVTGCWNAGTEKYTEENKRFVSNLVRAKLVEQSAEIEAFIQNVDGATSAEAATAFFAVAEGCPDEPLSRQMGITRNAARTAALFEEPQFKEFCKLCGDIAEIAPDLTDEDVGDVSIIVYQKFQKYARRGPTDRVLQGVRMLVAMANVEKGGSDETIYKLGYAAAYGEKAPD